MLRGRIKNLILPQYFFIFFSKSSCSCLILLISFCVFLFGWHSEAKFKRAMIFSGGGFNAAVFLGMLEGAESMGKSPDLILGTCGGSAAAAIAQVFPNSLERRRFVESREFHDFLANIGDQNKSSFSDVSKLILELNYRSRFSDKLPPIFTQFILNLPYSKPLKAIDVKFKNRVHDPSDQQGGISLVIPAAKLYFGPKDVEQDQTYSGRKLYQEVFFTDPETAYQIGYSNEFKSPLAFLFPQSAVQEDTDVLVDETLSTAIRSSISDPYLTNPMKLDKFYYLTGAIDLYPIELAYHLADEVILSFDEGFNNTVDVPAILTTFRYDSNERLRYVNDHYADYWIDRSDASALNKNFGFNPRFEPGGLNIRVPSDLSTFRAYIDEQWAWGKWRAIEALKNAEKNEKSHIRNMTRDNASKELREKYHHILVK